MTVQEQSELPEPEQPNCEQSIRDWARPRGKAHGLAVSAGIARSQVKRAAEQVKVFACSAAQDIARVVFSAYGRGQLSASSRKV